MQSGIETSRARIAAYNEATAATRIDIRPDTPSAEGKHTDLFGEDGLSFRDVLDAINPLNHIPIVSDLVKEATGHAVSPISRMIGATVLGGPIGFVASLASVIFEDATGQSPAEAMVAALSGDEAPATQVANNEAVVPDAEEPEEQVAQAVPVDPVSSNDAMVLASLEAAPNAVVKPPAPATHRLAGSSAGADEAVLTLYGSSAASAHDSYRKAQMLPYLRDVTTSNVL